MPGYLEVWGPAGRDVVGLSGDQFTIGADPSNDLTIDDDTAVSRLHALLARFPAGWCVRDLGSRNGTFVNGDRVVGDHALHAGDEVRVGRVRLILRGDEHAAGVTEGLADAPTLTPRERDVLVELCRPLLGGDAFTDPASVSEIARTLVVTDAAVKQHLLHLYDKFGIEETDRRRVRLANAALQTGAVSLGDLRPS
jgi:hypothetical protein